MSNQTKLLQKPSNQEKAPCYRYVAVEESLLSENGDPYVSYGIRVLSEAKQIAYVSDISTDAEKVHSLAELCTKMTLDPLHLSDVIDDFFAEESLSLS